MKHYLFILFFFLAMDTSAQLTPYELSNKNETATFDQAIDYYKKLDETFPQAKLLTYGQTDFGKPLHLLVLSKDKIFEPSLIRKKTSVFC